MCPGACETDEGAGPDCVLVCGGWSGLRVPMSGRGAVQSPPPPPLCMFEHLSGINTPHPP